MTIEVIHFISPRNAVLKKKNLESVFVLPSSIISCPTKKRWAQKHMGKCDGELIFTKTRAHIWNSFWSLIIDIINIFCEIKQWELFPSPTLSNQKALSPLHFQSRSTLPYWHHSNSVHKYVNISTFSLSLQCHLCLVKNPPAMQENWVQSQGWENPMEKRMATHSSILAWTVQTMGVAKSWTWLSNFHFRILLFLLLANSLFIPETT